jgi:immune inhibitor A
VQAPIGICSHEHGHSLGQDDLYDFSYTTTGDGNFDIMSYGTYGGSPIGVRPFHSGAYTKERYGWITPTTLAPGLYSLTLAPYETNAQVIKLYPNGATNSEYFLLENRQFLGFDNGMSDQGLCTGMVICHIDQNVIQNYFDANTINTLASAGGPPHQGVVVVEADGRYDMIKPPLNYGECSDTWKVGQTWDGNSTPNSNLWNGSPSNLSVTVTGNTDGTLTLSIKVGNFIANSFQYLPVVLRQFIAGW